MSETRKIKWAEIPPDTYNYVCVPLDVLTDANILFLLAGGNNTRFEYHGETWTTVYIKTIEDLDTACVYISKNDGCSRSCSTCRIDAFRNELELEEQWRTR